MESTYLVFSHIFVSPYQPRSGNRKGWDTKNTRHKKKRSKTTQPIRLPIQTSSDLDLPVFVSQSFGFDGKNPTPSEIYQTLQIISRIYQPQLVSRINRIGSSRSELHAYPARSCWSIACRPPCCRIDGGIWVMVSLLQDIQWTIIWLVVSTHLKNVSQNWTSSPNGGEHKNIWKHHLVINHLIKTLLSLFLSNSFLRDQRIFNPPTSGQLAHHISSTSMIQTNVVFWLI